MSSIPGNNSTTARISKGQTKTSSLTAAGDSDWYKAQFKSGLDYGFRLTGDGSANSLTGGDLYIRDADGNEVERSIVYSGTSNAISLSIGKTGTYYVDVRETNGGTGNYKLSWVGNDTVARDTATKAKLTSGKTISGAVDVSGDSDWFKVQLKSGFDYGFRLTGDGADALAGGDLYIRDADGNEVKRSVSYSGTSNALSLSIDKTGTYYVDIRETNGGTGNYKLSWVGNDTVARDTATRAKLISGETIANVLDVSGDSDWFKVQLKSGLDYGFRLTGDGSADSLVGGDLYIRDADGNEVKRSISYSGTSNALNLAIGKTGTYYVDIRETNGGTGNYKLTWNGADTVVNNTATKAVLYDGRSLTGAVDVAGDHDWYGFSAAKGVTYQFRLTGTGADALDGAYLVLRDADGNSFNYAYNRNGAVTIDWSSTKNQKIYLDVSGYNADHTGAFKLSVVSSAPLLKGSSGKDVITGGDGATRIYGYAGNDTLYGVAGNDKLYGGSGADRLYGGAGNDLLEGGSGNDTLYGGSGKDTLYGGTGADKLYGGSGADVFAFTSVGDSTVASKGRDTIFDFKRSQKDKIDLSAIDADTTADDDQKFDFIGTDAFSKTAGELRYEKKSGDTFVYGDVNGDGKADFSIRIDADISLRESDFIL